MPAGENESTARKLGDITLTKQAGTVLTLHTDKKYVSEDVCFNIGAKSGSGSVSVASTDASIENDSTVRNIANIVETKSSSAPADGFYLKIGAAGVGTSAITESGWMNEGNIGSSSASNSYFFTVKQATASVSGTNTVTPSASIAGTNVVLSNTNNGVSVTATGGGSASASVTATGSLSGYAHSGNQLGTGTVTGASQSTTASSYISGVVLNVPSSGTNTFTITLPNGIQSTITLTFIVDSNGNWSIE